MWAVRSAAHDNTDARSVCTLLLVLMDHENDLQTLEEIRSFLSRADFKTPTEQYDLMERKAEQLCLSLDQKRTRPDPMAGFAYVYVLDLRDALGGRAIEEARIYADVAIKALQNRVTGPESLSVGRSPVMNAFDRQWAEPKLTHAGFKVERGVVGGKEALFVSSSNRLLGFRAVAKPLEPHCQAKDLQRGLDGRIIMWVTD
jgi:hypothetical protein